jgi:hypothetical protein
MDDGSSALVAGKMFEMLGAIDKIEPFVRFAELSRGAIVVAENQTATGARKIFIPRLKLFAFTVTDKNNSGERAVVLNAISNVDLVAAGIKNRLREHNRFQLGSDDKHKRARPATVTVVTSL